MTDRVRRAPEESARRERCAVVGLLMALGILLVGAGAIILTCAAPESPPACTGGVAARGERPRRDAATGPRGTGRPSSRAGGAAREIEPGVREAPEGNGGSQAPLAAGDDAWGDDGRERRVLDNDASTRTGRCGAFVVLLPSVDRDLVRVGECVDLAGDLAVASCRYREGVIDCGYALVYRRGATGWRQESEIRPPDHAREALAFVGATGRRVVTVGGRVGAADEHSIRSYVAREGAVWELESETRIGADQWCVNWDLDDDLLVGVSANAARFTAWRIDESGARPVRVVRAAGPGLSNSAGSWVSLRGSTSVWYSTTLGTELAVFSGGAEFRFDRTLALPAHRDRAATVGAVAGSGDRLVTLTSGGRIRIFQRTASGWGEPLARSATALCVQPGVGTRPMAADGDIVAIAAQEPPRLALLSPRGSDWTLAYVALPAPRDASGYPRFAQGTCVAVDGVWVMVGTQWEARGGWGVGFLEVTDEIRRSGTVLTE